MPWKSKVSALEGSGDEPTEYDFAGIEDFEVEINKGICRSLNEDNGGLEELVFGVG